MARGCRASRIGVSLASMATSCMGLAAKVATGVDTGCHSSLDCMVRADSTSFLQVGLAAGSGRAQGASGAAQNAVVLEDADMLAADLLVTGGENNPYKLQDTDGTVCKLMAPLWRNAAALLGVNASAADDDECSFIDRWYWSRHERKGSSSNYIRGYKLGNFHLTYVPQWKCGNDNVRDNMRRLGVPEASLANIAAGMSEQDNDVDAWHGVHDWVPESEAFSIVREPLSRFVSGYNEIEYRIVKDKLCDASHTGMGVDCSEALRQGSEEFDDLEPLTDDRSLEFIKDILGYRLSPMVQYEHVFSMLGNLNAFTRNFGQRISFVGRTERWDDAWERMQHVGGLKFATFRDDLGGHGSSEYAAGDHMRDVLDTNENATLALACAVLLPDQLCLQYEPSVDTSSACTAAGFASAAGWASLTDDIRRLLCPDIRELQPLDAQ